MEDIQYRLRASHLLSLIAVLQIPISSAHPFVNLPYQTATVTADPDCEQVTGQGHPPTEHSLSGLGTTSWPSTTYTSTTDDWRPTATVYEISDGQIQVPYEVYTEDVTPTSGTSTFTSTETLTSSLTNLPRWWTGSEPEWTSGSWHHHWTWPTSTTTQLALTSSSSDVSTPTSEAATQSSTAPTQGAFGSSTSATSTVAETLSSTTTQTATTSVPDASLTSLTTSAVQTATASATQNTTGVVYTSLETSGNPNSAPFATSVASATSTLSLVSTATLSGVGPTATANVISIQASDIFQPIATDAPPSQIPQRGDHPVARLGIQQQQQRLQTNKFYANFFLGSQTSGTWTHPYSVAWLKGAGETDSWGLAMTHIEESQWATGVKDSTIDAGDWAFFASPVGIQSLVLAAAELGSDTTLTTDSLEAFSVNVNLASSVGADPLITFPLLQGMAFVTGIYNSGTPLVQSGIGISNLTYAGAVIEGTTYKYRATLQNQVTWLIYVTPMNPGYSENSFTLLSTGIVQGPSGFGGYIQIAKVPLGCADAESTHDASAGAYPTAASISGSVQGTAGTYTLSWTKKGVASQPLLMFALPHQVQSFSSGTSAGATDVQLQTTTKGMATAIQGDTWTLEEPNLPISMDFAPWSPETGDLKSISAAAAEAIQAAGTAELSQNVSKQTNVGSLYYDGKALANFAAICYAVNDMAGNATLAQTGLLLLKDAFAQHLSLIHI